MEIVKVVAKKQGTGFRYFGVNEAGERVVLRKQATRLYQKAFQYEKAVGVGSGLAGFFTYGKNPSYALPCKTYLVTLEA